MLAWTVAVALAQEPTLPTPLPAYPSELPDRVDPTGRWARADRQGAKATRIGAALCVGATGATLTSLGLMALQDEAGPYVAGSGGILFLVAGPALVSGPPVLLGGSLRSRRSLKERGVRVSALPGAFGWTLYGLTPYLAAIPDDQGGFAMLSYGGAMALGMLQSHLNQQGRRRAGLVDPIERKEASVRVGVAPELREGRRGVALVATF